MDKIIIKSRHKIFFVSPKQIKNCIYPSKFCDFVQYNMMKLHPHAGKNRGVFREDPSGCTRINEFNWDHKIGILFSALLEFKALKNHYTGKENWKKSKFANRHVEFIKFANKNVEYVKKNGIDWKIIDHKVFISNRQNEIDRLFSSILKKGLNAVGINKKNNKIFNDNISCVLTKNKELLFNNRGHHRLSIAKILNLSKIPIKITVVKNRKIYNDFLMGHK